MSYRGGEGGEARYTENKGMSYRGGEGGEARYTENKGMSYRGGEGGEARYTENSGMSYRGGEGGEARDLLDTFAHREGDLRINRQRAARARSCPRRHNTMY